VAVLQSCRPKDILEYKLTSNLLHRPQSTGTLTCFRWHRRDSPLEPGKGSFMCAGFATLVSRPMNIALRLNMPDPPAHNYSVLFPVFGSAQALGGHRSNSSDHSRRLKLLTPEQKSAYLRQGSIMRMHGHHICVLATRACYEMRRLTLLTISLYAYRDGSSRGKIAAKAQTKVHKWLWSCREAS